MFFPENQRKFSNQRNPGPTKGEIQSETPSWTLSFSFPVLLLFSRGYILPGPVLLPRSCRGGTENFTSCLYVPPLYLISDLEIFTFLSLLEFLVSYVAPILALTLLAWGIPSSPSALQICFAAGTKHSWGCKDVPCTLWIKAVMQNWAALN